MRAIILVLGLSTFGLASAQLTWTSRNVVNRELEFFMSPATVQGLVPIRDAQVLVGTDTINLKNTDLHFGKWWAPDGMFSYYALGLDDADDSLFAVLTFSNERLIEVAFYARGHYAVNALYHETDRWLGASGRRSVSSQPDSTVRYSDRIVEYGDRPVHRSVDGVKDGTRLIFEEDCRTGIGQLTMYDIRTLNLMPGFCGNDKRHVTWENFAAYMRSKQLP